ncbi:MAG: hypothetical protein ACOX42_07210 [Clostridia bacterium]
MRSKRSRRNKTKKIAAKVIGATIKGTARMTMITAVSATLLIYPNNIRYTTAYFTSGTVNSGKITFQLVARTQDVNAMVDYQLGTIAQPVTMMAMGMPAAAPDELFSVIAYISFPVDCGFEVDNIDIRSIELHYNRHTASVLAGTARFEGSALVVEFDWDAVEGWLGDVVPGERPKFRVTGEGVREEDGRKFTFSADNVIEINREEMVEITLIEVLGPGDIVIPAEGEGLYGLHQYDIMVFDAEGKEVPGVEVSWSVTGQGVRISQDGVLTVTPAAAPGTITVAATLRSDDKVQGIMDVTLAAAEEILEEIPPEELLPEELLPTEELPPPLELVPEEDLGEEQPPVEEELPGEELPGDELPTAEELHPPKEDGEDDGQDVGETGDDTPREGEEEGDTGEGDDTGDGDIGADDDDNAGDVAGRRQDGDDAGDGEATDDESTGDDSGTGNEQEEDDGDDIDGGDTGEDEGGTDEEDIDEDDTGEMSDGEAGENIDDDEEIGSEADRDNADYKESTEEERQEMATDVSGKVTPRQKRAQPKKRVKTSAYTVGAISGR